PAAGAGDTPGGGTPPARVAATRTIPCTRIDPAASVIAPPGGPVRSPASAVLVAMSAPRRPIDREPGAVSASVAGRKQESPLPQSASLAHAVSDAAAHRPPGVTVIVPRIWTSGAENSSDAGSPSV